MNVTNAVAPNSLHTVLVVDDSPAGRYSLARSLQAAGFKTVECAGGSEALQLAGGDVAAVVLDVNLPDLHGFEVCRLLRANGATANLPIVHVSAVHMGAEDRQGGLAAGADAYYLSPVDPAVLVATLEALIRARANFDALRERERVYRGMFDRAPCAMLLVDDKGRVAEANGALVKLLQSTRKGLVRRSLSGLAPKEWTARVDEAVAQWGSETWRGEFPVISPVGDRIELEWYAAPHVQKGWSVAVVAEARVPGPTPARRNLA